MDPRLVLRILFRSLSKRGIILIWMIMILKQFFIFYYSCFMDWNQPSIYYGYFDDYVLIMIA